MPRGGARPGAGRPRKCADRAEKRLTKAQIRAAAAAKNQTPLDFMLAVMNDPAEDMKFRAQMAQAAAPYIHAKPGEEKKGKKEEAQDRADAINDRFRGVGPPKLKAVK
jgi:phage terminase small subunit